MDFPLAADDTAGNRVGIPSIVPILWVVHRDTVRRRRLL
jgi:hypothetical protein